MAVGGALLRFGQTGLRVIELGCAIVALAIFSYFLAVLADHNLHIATYLRAVEGIAGAGVLYLLFAVLLTLCLGGISFFGLIAVFLDICFIGGFIAIAWFTRHGANSCTGNVNTPLGSGPANSKDPGYGANGFGFGNGEDVTYLPNLHQACRLNTAVFAVSIIAVFLFIITAFLQIMLVRHHKKEKRYGPGPSNNYTSGAGRRPFWKRNKKVHNTRDAEMATAGVAGAGAAAGTHHHQHDMRPSYDTGHTENTLNDPATIGYPEAKFGEPGYGQTGYGHTPNSGYNTTTYNTPAHHTTTTTATNY